MIQEYLAFGIFSSAILYSLVALVRFAFSFNKNSSPGCNDNCNCKEIKKPKAEKPKVLATANSLTGKPAISISGKKVK